MNRLFAALAALVCFACSSPARGPATCDSCAPGTGGVELALSVTANDVGRVTATISAWDFDPISLDLTVSGVPPFASGTITNVPAGRDRVVSLEARALAPEETIVIYRGEKMTDIEPGLISTVEVVLLPVLQDLSVAATFPPGDPAFASVHHVSATVTGPRITAPTTFYLQVDLINGLAAGTVEKVPVGATRTLIVRAYDAGGALLHEATKDIAVVEGAPVEAIVALSSATGGLGVSGGFCVPACGAAVCGDDGCGGSCGGCVPGDQCSGGACITPPPPLPPPDPPLPEGWAILRESPDSSPVAVWGAGPNDVWVASQQLGSHQALLEHWDGTAFTAATGLPDGTRIKELWGTATDNAWAIGSLMSSSGGFDPTTVSTAVIFHWDGVAWTESFRMESISFDSIFGTDANNIWVAGHGQALMVRWDGTAWSPSFPTITFGAFNGLWASGPDDLWGVGPNEGAVQHWDGQAWTSRQLVPLPYHWEMSFLWDVWGSSSTDVWAVGTNGNSPATSLIWHFDGSAWSVTRQGQGSFYAVTGTGPADVWAMGVEVAHYDGAKWTFTPRLRPGTSIEDAWAIGPNDVWAVGWDGVPPTAGIIFHYAR